MLVSAFSFHHTWTPVPPGITPLVFYHPLNATPWHSPTMQVIVCKAGPTPVLTSFRCKHEFSGTYATWTRCSAHQLWHRWCFSALRLPQRLRRCQTPFGFLRCQIKASCGLTPPPPLSPYLPSPFAPSASPTSPPLSSPLIPPPGSQHQSNPIYPKIVILSK